MTDQPGRVQSAWSGCCAHPAHEHDQHGCIVDVSTDRRVYERCHGLRAEGRLPLLCRLRHRWRVRRTESIRYGVLVTERCRRCDTERTTSRVVHLV